MRCIFLSVIIGLSLSVSAVTHQIQDVKFRRLDTRNGLTSSQVNQLMRDSRGFVWLSTPFGLCRYDGYRMQTYFSYVRDTTTLKNNNVVNVSEAYDGKLWLDHGMSFSVFDPVTERVDRNPSLWLAEHGVKGALEAVHIDTKKRFWVKTYDNGLYILEPQTDKVMRINFGYGPDELPKEFGVSRFSEQGDNMIIVSKMGELLCIQAESGKFLWRNDDLRRLDIYADYEVYYDEENDLIWVYPHGGTAYVLDCKTKHWYMSFGELMRAKGMSDVPDDIIVWDVLLDRNKHIWVSTDHMGVFVIDLKGGVWKQFINDKNNSTSLPDMTCRQLYEDQLGRMWVCTYKNGIAMSSAALANFTHLPVGDVNAVVEDKAGNYWLGLNSGGILKMDSKTHEVTETYNKHNINVLNDVVVSAWAASDGSVWFGTWEGGAICYRGGKWTNYLSSDPGSQMKTNNVWGITEDRRGNIWLGLLGAGVMCIDKNTGRQVAVRDDNSVLHSVWTMSLNTSPKGWLLQGTEDYCSMINPVTKKVVNITLKEDENSYSTSHATTDIIMDSRGLLWHGSPSGILVYDMKEKKSQLLDMKYGFYGSSVVSVREDEKHTIWVVTEHGISNVTPQRDEDTGWWKFSVRSFNELDGLQPGPFNQRSTFIARDGNLLVGGVDGLDIINTHNLYDNDDWEKPVFSGLLLFDREVSVGEKVDGRVILKESLSLSKRITLRYSDQFIIQLGSNSALVNNGKRFVYRLEGFNDVWVKTLENYPNIIYNSLQSGDYTLHVRMLNDDGTIGNEESVLQITILPPLWRTSWMILLYLVIFGAMAWWWYRLSKKRQQERQQLELLRRETEKKHWMSEMKKKMTAENTSQVFVAGEDGIQETTQTIAFDRTNVVQLFREVCDDFKIPEGKNTRLSFFPFVDVLEVMVNKPQMREMLQILLTNAIVFSPSSSKVKVFVERAQDKAVLRVADSGLGIPDEVKPYLFEEIIGDDDTPNLHKVFDIVEAHHGTIRAEENKGGGTLFVIELPCAEDMEVEEAVLMEDHE